MGVKIGFEDLDLAVAIEIAIVKLPRTGRGLLMAITAGTFAFWIVRLVDSEPAASGGLRPLAWIGVGGVLAAFVVATLIAARGELSAAPV